MILSESPDKTRKRIEILLDIEDNLLFFIDDSGHIKDVNQNGAQLINLPKSEIINKHITDLIAFRSRTTFSEAFNKMLETRDKVQFQSSFFTPIGTEIIVAATIIPVVYENEIYEIVFAGRNITLIKELNDQIENLRIKLTESERLIAIERQRANQKRSILEELNRLKSEFISNISHEFRTPLASIIGFSETILSDPDMPEDMKLEFNNIILTEGKRLAKLINDVLDISRIEGGLLDLQKTNFDIVQLIAELIEANIQAAMQKQITISSEMPDEEILIEADRDRIAQVISRLLSNAIKFTGTGGRVKVILQSLFKEIEIVISDTGIGIPEKEIPFIFQKFYRVSRPGTEIPGTGLGLVFVKQIVDLHKGFISVQSESGKGTTFVVKLLKNNVVIS
jgi:PAS domain S-box-containing protein